MDLRHNPLFVNRQETFEHLRFTDCVSSYLQYEGDVIDLGFEFTPPTTLRVASLDNSVDCTLKGKNINETLTLSPHKPRITQNYFEQLDSVSCTGEATLTIYTTQSEPRMKLGLLVGVIADVKRALGLDDIGRLVFVSSRVLACLPPKNPVQPDDVVVSLSSGKMYKLKTVTPGIDNRGILRHYECDVVQTFLVGERT